MKQPNNLSQLLPKPFQWCVIPSGKVTLQYGGSTSDQTFELPTFYMAQYPITNAQFKVFEQATDGYANPDWWDFAEHAKQWRAKNTEVLSPTYRDDTIPRTNIAWYDAIAFCRWISASLDNEFIITLPSEQEWQRAAQGNDNRKYPWGDRFYANYCNTREGGIGAPTPVTQFPDGASPFGVMDMVGNLTEYTGTVADINSTDIKLELPRETRGASFAMNKDKARNTFRTRLRMNRRSNSHCFRLVCLPRS